MFTRVKPYFLRLKKSQNSQLISAPEISYNIGVVGNVATHQKNRQKKENTNMSNDLIQEILAEKHLKACIAAGRNEPDRSHIRSAWKSVGSTRSRSR